MTVIYTSVSTFWLGWRGDRIPKKFHRIAFTLSEGQLNVFTGKAFEAVEDENADQMDKRDRKALEAVKTINDAAYAAMKSTLIQEIVNGAIASSLKVAPKVTEIVLEHQARGFKTPMGKIIAPTFEVMTDQSGNEEIESAILGFPFMDADNPTILHPHMNGFDGQGGVLGFKPDKFMRSLALIENFRQAMVETCPEFKSAEYLLCSSSGD